MTEEFRPKIINKEDDEIAARRIRAIETELKSLHARAFTLDAEWRDLQAHRSIYRGYTMVVEAKNKQVQETVLAVNEAEYLAQRKQEITTEKPDWLQWSE